MDPSIHERLVQLEKAQAERAKFESDANRLMSALNELMHNQLPFLSNIPTLLEDRLKRLHLYEEIATLMKDRFKQLRSRETLATCFYVLFAVSTTVQAWSNWMTNSRINTLKKDLDKIERQLEPANGGGDGIDKR